MFGCDPNARVSDHQFNFSAGQSVRRQRDYSTGLGVSRGVDQEIVERVPQALGIDRDGGQRHCGVDVEYQFLTAQQRPDAFGRPAQQFGGVFGSQSNRLATLLESGERQEVIDDADEPFGVVPGVDH